MPRLRNIIELKHRRAAKIAVSIDVFLSGIYIAMLSLCIFAGTYTMLTNQNFFTMQLDGSEITLISFVFLSLLISYTDIWAALMLLKALNQEHPPDHAKMLATGRTWMKVARVFLFAEVSLSVYSGVVLALGVQIVIRGTMMYCVNKFVKELETKLR